ncbi:MAG: type II secretion system protein [Burkholderiales bacterium]
MRKQGATLRFRADGFTLVELAVVFAIVALLLAGAMYTLSAQTEQHNFVETRQRLDQARDLVLSFAVVNGRLPCPARFTSTSNNSQGLESFCPAATGSCAGSETTTIQTHGNCSNYYDGYLPAASIGYRQTDSNGFALDVWGNRIRYVVAKTNANCTTTPPPNTILFTSQSNLKQYGISCQPSDLLVCKSATGISGTNCGGSANQIMTQDLLTAIIFSTGKNGAQTTPGTDESANLNGDPILVYHTPTPSTAANGEFDDQFTWITVGELYRNLISAGQLP